jgi:hypothetical protein
VGQKYRHDALPSKTPLQNLLSTENSLINGNGLPVFIPQVNHF